MRSGRRKRVGRLSFEARLRLLCAALIGPGVVAAGGLLAYHHASAALMLSVGAAILIPSLIAGAVLLEQIVRPLQTLSNVIGALREDDYAFRARGETADDALGELAREINGLADMLRDQRTGSMEAAALLRRVVEAMDAPVLAFDPRNTLRLLNPAAQRVFAVSASADVGRSAEELGLADLLRAPDESLVSLEAEGRPGRWMVHRTAFRQRGVPHTLLVLSDVSAALREEERQAWRRLIRVLGHEINNSLAPIKSIAGSLRSQLERSAGAAQGGAVQTDLARGLSVIESRAESLHRFVQQYRRLAQLPPPTLRPAPLRPLLERTLALETRMAVEIATGPDATVRADPDQLEQMFINLIRNAVEAAQLCAGAPADWTAEAPREEPRVVLGWAVLPDRVEVWIDDNGPGLSNPSNLFVPFYTTKPEGAGVGLALARQIAEAHGGTLELRSRDEGGCRATVTLPALRLSS